MAGAKGWHLRRSAHGPQLKLKLQPRDPAGSVSLSPSHLAASDHPKIHSADQLGSGASAAFMAVVVCFKVLVFDPQTTVVCIENFIRIDLVRESLNVDQDGRPDMSLLEPGCHRRRARVNRRARPSRRSAIANVRVRKRAEILARGPSCVSPTRSSNAPVLLGLPCRCRRIRILVFETSQASVLNGRPNPSRSQSALVPMELRDELRFPRTSLHDSRNLKFVHFGLIKFHFGGYQIRPGAEQQSALQRVSFA
jgi:hypothetical protein